MPGEKIGFLSHFLNRFRYSSFLRIVLDGISKTGIRIFPYYIVLEGLFNRSLSHLETGFDEHKIGFLGPQDMNEISISKQWELYF